MLHRTRENVMQREAARYKVKRMSRLLFGPEQIYGVVDTHRGTTVYTSTELSRVEKHCDVLNENV